MKSKILLSMVVAVFVGCGASNETPEPDGGTPDGAASDGGVGRVDCTSAACGGFAASNDADGTPRQRCGYHTDCEQEGSACVYPDLVGQAQDWCSPVEDSIWCQQYVEDDQQGHCAPPEDLTLPCELAQVCMGSSRGCWPGERLLNLQCPRRDCSARVPACDPDDGDCVLAALAQAEPGSQVKYRVQHGEGTDLYTLNFFEDGKAMVDRLEHNDVTIARQFGPVTVDAEVLSDCGAAVFDEVFGGCTGRLLVHCDW